MQMQRTDSIASDPGSREAARDEKINRVKD